MELLDHMVVIFIFFINCHSVSSVVARPFHIPTTSGQGFQFPTYELLGIRSLILVL